MTYLPDVLNLPLDTIAVLAAGYLGYRLAYVGKDAGHSSVDVVFLSLVYALSAKLVLQLASGVGLLSPVGIILAISAALLVAALWRSWGEGATFRALRFARVSNSDRHRTAWDSVRHKPSFAPTGYTVSKVDGTVLLCQNPQDFAHLRDGPCILGEDGSIAMFVTHRRLPGQADWEKRDTFDPVLGYEMTYIPASMVAEIRIDTLN
jgi:hypothetical protein